MLKLIVVVSWVLASAHQSLELRTGPRFRYLEDCMSHGEKAGKTAMRMIEARTPGAAGLEASWRCELAEERVASR